MAQIINISKINICEETPVDLILNGKRAVTFMCTPSNLCELAVGYLFSNDLIDRIEDIYTLGACDEMRKIVVTSRKMVDDGFQLGSVLASSCGATAQFSEKYYNKPKNKSGFKIPMTKIKQQIKDMFSKAELYKKYGGLHCAALSDGNNILAIREDVGRHNAVDKVIGKGVFLGVNFKASMIMTTGRISTDMILKAVNIGSPIIISRSIPTTLALEIAERFGITIIGRAITSRPIVYTYEDRIIGDEVLEDGNVSS